MPTAPSGRSAPRGSRPVHESVLAFVAAHREASEPPVLEVGSYNVNGSVRELLPTPYTGVDVQPGPGVDMVADAGELPFPDAAFGTVVSTEMLEHALDPVACIAEMVRVLRPGGLLLVTARGNGFPHHNPPDRWRIMPGTLAEILTSFGCDPIEQGDIQVPGVFVAARKVER